MPYRRNGLRDPGHEHGEMEAPIVLELVAIAARFVSPLRDFCAGRMASLPFGVQLDGNGNPDGRMSRP